MKGNQILGPLFIGALILFYACTNNTLTHQTLNGYWKLESATREGQPTTTLEGTYLEFSSTNHTMSTNLPIGLSGEQPYALTGQTVEVKTASPSLIFEVESVSETDMKLAFQTRGFTFLLSLKKSEKPLDSGNNAKPVE